MDPIDPKRHPEEGEQAEHSFEGGWRKAEEGMRSIKEQATETLEAARRRFSENARSALVQQKDRSVGSLRRLSTAIHEAASRLDREGDHTLAEYTDLLGTQVDKATSYLQERDASNVLRDLEGLARRQAGLLIGGMFVAGLIAARFIRSSQAQSSSETESPASGELAPSPGETPEQTASPPGSVSPGTSRFGEQGFGASE